MAIINFKRCFKEIKEICEMVIQIIAFPFCIIYGIMYVMHLMLAIIIAIIKHSVVRWRARNKTIKKDKKI